LGEEREDLQREQGSSALRGEGEGRCREGYREADRGSTEGRSEGERREKREKSS
jgi:hypothetical protein